MILLADDHVLVVNKPPGLLSVAPPGGGGRNLADDVRRRERAEGRDAFPVHRLDRDTSGVLVLARTRPAKEALEAAFRERRVRKTYLALVQGVPRTASGVVRSYIVDHGATARSSRTPVRGGKSALTRWRVRERFARAALLEVEPETGRFNQIRLHMVDLGHPLVGERKYAVGSRDPVRFKRFLLHAARLEFPHPATERVVKVEAPLPDDFESLLRELRARAR